MQAAPEQLLIVACMPTYPRGSDALLSAMSSLFMKYSTEMGKEPCVFWSQHFFRGFVYPMKPDRQDSCALV